jgi:hypothetical protein
VDDARPLGIGPAGVLLYRSRVKTSPLSFVRDLHFDIDAVERDVGLAYLVFADGTKRANVLDALRGAPARGRALAGGLLLEGAPRLLPFQSPTVVATAIYVLALGGEDAKADLVRLTKHTAPSAVLHARIALASMGAEKAAPAPKQAKTLIAALGEKAPKARVTAIAELVRIAAPESLAGLRAALEDRDPAVRAEAARALGTLGDTEVFERLHARFLARPKVPPASARGSVPAAIVDALSSYDALVRLGDARAVESIVALAREPRYATWIHKVAEHTPVAALAAMQPVGIAGIAELALADEGVLDEPLFVTHMQDARCAAASKSILGRWRTNGPATKLGERTAVAESLDA